MGTVYNKAYKRDKDGNLIPDPKAKGRKGKWLKDDKKPDYWVRYKDADGKWKDDRSHQPSKEQARKFLASIEANIAAGRVGIERKPTKHETCGALFDKWLETLTNRDAYGDRKRLEKHLRPMFGGMQARAVTLPVIKDWVTAQRKGRAPRVERAPKARELAPLPDGHKRPGPKPKAKPPKAKREPGKVLSEGSIRHNLNLLSRFMSWCVEHEHVPHNPVRDLSSNARPKQAAKELQPWLEDDAAAVALMKALPAPIDLMFYLGNRAGLRTGELVGLRLSDLGWMGEGVIRVRHSYDGPLKEDRGKSAAPKVKWVPCPDDAADRLAPLLAARREAGAEPEDHVFTVATDHGPAAPSKMVLHRAWESACAAVSVKLTWYQATRHSFASRSLSRDASLDETSAALGHSSPVVTQRYYNHFVRKRFSATLRAGLPSEV